MQISDNIIESRTINEAAYNIRMAKADSPAEFASIIRIARSDLRYTNTSANADEKVANVKGIIHRVISESEVKMSRLKCRQTMEKADNVLAASESAVAAVMSLSNVDDGEKIVGVATRNQKYSPTVDVTI